MLQVLDKSFDELNKAVNVVVDGNPNDMHDAWNIIYLPITSASIIGGGSSGFVEYDWDSIAAKFKVATDDRTGDIDTATDCIFTKFIKPSGAKVTGTGNLYVAWLQPSGADSNTGFHYMYKLNEGGSSPSVFPTTTVGAVPSSSSNEVYPRPETGEMVYQLTKLAELDISDKDMFTELVAKLTIYTKYSSDILVCGLVVQMNFDQLGSRTQTEK